MSIAEEKEKTVYERFKTFLRSIFYSEIPVKENEQNLLNKEGNRTSVAVLKNWPRREAYPSLCKQASTQTYQGDSLPR